MVLFMLFYVLFITILCINNHIEYKNKQKIEKNDIVYNRRKIGHSVCHFLKVTVDYSLQISKIIKILIDTNTN
jgi:hypothetical protein